MNYKNKSDIELTNHLKSLGRELSKQKKKHQNCNPLTPQDFVEIAKTETAIDDIKTEQVIIGKILLERDKKRQINHQKILESKISTGVETANELLERLPEFVDKVSIAFKVLGNEYAELLTLSHEVRKTNMMLLGANKPQCVPSAMRIEPNNLHKLIKECYRTSFGADATNVFLPQQTNNLDIIEVVKKIQQECTERKIKSCLIGA